MYSSFNMTAKFSHHSVTIIIVWWGWGLEAKGQTSLKTNTEQDSAPAKSLVKKEGGQQHVSLWVKSNIHVCSSSSLKTESLNIEVKTFEIF